MWNKLPEDFKKQWVEALRSGKYSQTVGELFNSSIGIKNVWNRDGEMQEILYEPNGHCCLGVACSIIGINNEVMDGVGNPSSLYEKFEETISVEEGNKFFSLLPEELRGETFLVDTLIRFNDEELWTFNKIADWIEENL